MEDKLRLPLIRLSANTRTNLAVCWLPHCRTCINLTTRSWQMEIWLSSSCGDTWKSGCLPAIVTLENQGCLAATVTGGMGTLGNMAVGYTWKSGCHTSTGTHGNPGMNQLRCWLWEQRTAQIWLSVGYIAQMVFTWLQNQAYVLLSTYRWTKNWITLMNQP